MFLLIKFCNTLSSMLNLTHYSFNSDKVNKDLRILTFLLPIKFLDFLKRNIHKFIKQYYLFSLNNFCHFKKFKQVTRI